METIETIITIAVGIVTILGTIWAIYYQYNKKPKPDSQNNIRKEPTADQVTIQNPVFTTTEGGLTDYDRKILLLNKLGELEENLAEFKKILQKVQMSSINHDPTPNTEDK